MSTTPPTVSFPLLPDKPDVEFRFTLKSARALEREARPFGGIEALRFRGSNVEVLLMLTFHALSWSLPKLTDDKVLNMVQAFVDAGGNTVDLVNALNRALTASGVYGIAEPAAEENPTSPAGTKSPNPPETTEPEKTAA